MRKLETINYQNNLYEVKRKIKESHGPIIETWKEHLASDMVLRGGEWLYFCNIIPDLEIINNYKEKINEKKNTNNN